MKTQLTSILYTSHKIPKSHKHIIIGNIHSSLPQVIQAKINITSCDG